MTRQVETLDRMPLIDGHSGDINVVVETPRGSRNKYKYDTQRGAMRLGATLGEGLAFPLDFGFFPSTRGEDGDPLDVLLFLDEGVPSGCVATARLIGVMEVEQKEKRKPWKRNDRFFAVATHAHRHRAVRRLSDLPRHFLPEIEAFLVHYTGLDGKSLRVLRYGGPRRAHDLLRIGQRVLQSRGQAIGRASK
jgi:inorganic pyrophosphatase